MSDVSQQIEDHTIRHLPGLWVKMLAIMLVTLLVLAMFRSSDLVTSAYDLPEHPYSERLVTMAETWHGWMEQAGPAGWSERIGERTEEWREMSFEEFRDRMKAYF